MNLIAAGLYCLARGAAIWFSGRRWQPPASCPARHRYTHDPASCPRCSRRQLLTQPVRAVAQTGLTVLVIGLIVAPRASLAVVAALALTLAAAAAAARVWFRFQNRVTVHVGTPVRNRPPERRELVAAGWPASYRGYDS